MLKVKLFKEKSLFEKLKFTVYNLPEDKMFYSAFALILVFLIFVAFTIIYTDKFTTFIPKRGTTLNMYSEEDIRYIMPLYATNNLEKFTSALIYSSLVRKINDNYMSDLADSVTVSEDGLTIKVKIKDNAKFSDGTEVKSEDVQFTFELAANPIVDYIDRVKYEGIKFEVVDDKNINIILRKKYSNINDILTIGIVKKSEYSNESIDSTLKSNLSFESVGSGIYKIDTVMRDSSNNVIGLNLKYNKNSEILPINSHINIYSSRETSDIINEIKKSSAINNVVFDTNKPEYETLLTNDYVKSDYSLPRITAIYLNPSRVQLFAKKENRKAIYDAIDRDYLVNNILSGYATTTYDLLPASKNINYTGPVYNQLNSSTTIKLTVINTQSRIDIGNYIKNELAKIGLNIEIVPVDNVDIINNNIKNRDFDMLLYTTEIDSPVTLYAFWDSSQRNAPGYNFSGYASKGFDTNLETIRSGVIQDDVRDAVKSMQNEFYEEYPYIPLFTPSRSTYFNKENNIYIPNYINGYKELTQNIDKWYSEKEKVYKFIGNYSTKIDNIYKLIH